MTLAIASLGSFIIHCVVLATVELIRKKNEVSSFIR